MNDKSFILSTQNISWYIIIVVRNEHITHAVMMCVKHIFNTRVAYRSSDRYGLIGSIGSADYYVDALSKTPHSDVLVLSTI